MRATIDLTFSPLLCRSVPHSADNNVWFKGCSCCIERSQCCERDNYRDGTWLGCWYLVEDAPLEWTKESEILLRHARERPDQCGCGRVNNVTNHTLFKLVYLNSLWSFLLLRVMQWNSFIINNFFFRIGNWVLWCRFCTRGSCGVNPESFHCVSLVNAYDNILITIIFNCLLLWSNAFLTEHFRLFVPVLVL